MPRLAAGLSLALALALSACTPKPAGGPPPRRVEGKGSPSAPSSPATRAPDSPPSSEETPVASAPATTVPVFVYHFVQPASSDYIAITPEMFEKHLRALRLEGYQTITAREWAEAVRGRGALPPKPVLLTFDDGTEDQYRYAVPLLRKYGDTATFFVYPLGIGRDSFMTRAQVASLARLGFDVEAHTWDHRSLLRRPSETPSSFSSRVRDTARRTNDWIFDVTGLRPEVLAYPYGWYSSETFSAVRKAYAMAYTVNDGVNRLPVPEPLATKRFTVFRKDTLEDFVIRLHSRPLLIRRLSPTAIVQGPSVPISLETASTRLLSGTAQLVVDTKPVAARVSVTARGTLRAGVTLDLSPGFHYITFRARDDRDTWYYSSWGIVVARR